MVLLFKIDHAKQFILFIHKYVAEKHTSGRHITAKFERPIRQHGKDGDIIPPAGDQKKFSVSGTFDSSGKVFCRSCSVAAGGNGSAPQPFAVATGKCGDGAVEFVGDKNPVAAGEKIRYRGPEPGGGNDIFCFGGNWGNDTVEQLAGGKITLWFESGSENCGCSCTHLRNGNFAPDSGNLQCHSPIKPNQSKGALP